jgi:L-fuconolactonase
LGVVGWVDLRSPGVQKQLAEFAPHPKFVGVRHVVQDEPDPHFMRGKEFRRGIAALGSLDLTYDILIFPQQLTSALELVRDFPDQRFVLDHMAKPAIREDMVSPWCEQMRDLAACPNLMCKVSGLVTEARWQDWKADHFRPYLDVVFETFGADRLMYGSDWPVALLAANYGQVFGLVADYLAQSSQSAEAQVFGLNAARFYNL